MKSLNLFKVATASVSSRDSGNHYNLHKAHNFPDQPLLWQYVIPYKHTDTHILAQNEMGKIMLYYVLLTKKVNWDDEKAR